MASSLREALESAVNEVEARESTLSAAPEAEAAPVVEAPAAEVPAVEAAPAETPAERKRAEDGKFAAETPRERAIRLGTIKPAGAPAATVAAPAPVVAKIPRPDSWKKEMAEHWDKFDPAVAKYIKEREDQYFKGVSTYKQEWEGATQPTSRRGALEAAYDQHASGRV